MSLVTNQSTITWRAGTGLLWLAALLAAAGCNRGESASAAEAATPAEVTVGAENVAVAERQEIRSGPTISGNLEPEWSATVRAEVSGAVLQTYAEAGQRVGAGAMLARIDDSAIRDSYLSAKQTVGSAEVAADLARRNLERTETLN
ncbi:MAG TPA: hypothetical protein VFS05_03190, partial [Gemmatimonadaceae bacterium]|nr:hypothetical protein [Gemmatimonadaceae bacterium]